MTHELVERRDTAGYFAGFYCKHCEEYGSRVLAEAADKTPCPSLLASRLCAIAFEAGLYGEREVGLYEDGKTYRAVKAWVILRETSAHEEVE